MKYENSFVLLLLQALSLHPSVVNSMNLWALCGMGYTLGQFFQLKLVMVLERAKNHANFSSKTEYFRYVVMYGWSCFVAKVDGVDAPPHPKCIGRYFFLFFPRHSKFFLLQFVFSFFFPLIESASECFPPHPKCIGRFLFSCILFPPQPKYFFSPLHPKFFPLIQIAS